MKKRTGRLAYYVLLIDAVFGLIFCFLALNTRVKVFAPYYGLKLKAAEYTSLMYERIKEVRREKGIPVDSINDPNESGLIGMQLTPITTEFGDLTAKLTSVNPNFSALFVEYMKKLHLKKGDVVAVHFTGSFPALNIAMLAAIKTLELKPVIISSVGSSMWGANIPEFTYLDMETILSKSGLINVRTVYASAGGIDDIGRGLSPEGRELIREAIKRNSIKEITAEDLSESIHLKYKVYEAIAGESPIKCFINIGGNAAVLAGVEVPSGIVSFDHRNHPGLIGEFLRRGIPVINIYSVNYLARRYGLPATSTPIPSPGEGKLFFEVRYSVLHAALYLILYLLILAFTLIVDVDYYFKKLLRRA